MSRQLQFTLSNLETDREKYLFTNQEGSMTHINTQLGDIGASTVKEENVFPLTPEISSRFMGFDGVMKFMHSLSSKIGEATYHSGDGATNPNAKLTPQQAKSQIDALKKDSAFVQKYLSGDVEAKETMSRLHKFANPSS